MRRPDRLGHRLFSRQHGQRTIRCSKVTGPPTGRNFAYLVAPSNGFDGARGGARFVFNVVDTTFTLASYFTRLDFQGVRFLNPGPGVLADPNFFNNLFRPTLGGTFDTLRRSDSANFVIGWDMTQFITWLNPAQTFLISTQFFMRHCFDTPQCKVHKDGQSATSGFETVDCFGVPALRQNNSTRVVSRPATELVQTLLINTTYNVDIPLTRLTTQVTPGLALFYDWQGMIVFQPSLRFVRDPWCFVVDYPTINAGVYDYQFGLLRDRSTVRFQIEYVL